jgi:hypothetical protein
MFITHLVTCAWWGLSTVMSDYTLTHSCHSLPSLIPPLIPSHPIPLLLLLFLPLQVMFITHLVTCAWWGLSTVMSEYTWYDNPAMVYDTLRDASFQVRPTANCETVVVVMLLLFFLLLF